MPKLEPDTPLTAPALKARALRLLARREHSRVELQRKLARLGAEPSAIDALLDELEASGKLSEARLVEQTIAIRGKRFGRLKLAHELRAKGVSDAAIEALLDSDPQSELQAATTIWRRKFGQLPNSLQDKARQVRFLQNRGFSREVIYQILSLKD